MIMIMLNGDDDDDDDDVYSKLQIYYIGMESDFFNCLRIDDLLTPLSKKEKKKQEERQIN